MSDTIYMREKDSYKKEYHELVTRVYFSGKPETAKTASLKMSKPLVEKVEGPFNEEDELVEEMEVGKTYIFKATKFQQSTLTPIKNIWWAEEIDDNGKIVDLELTKENLYEENGAVCFKYEAKECEKVRIYAYMSKPIKKVSIESEIIFNLKKVVVFFIGGAGDKESYYGASATEIIKDEVHNKFDDIKNNVLSKISDKDNTSIYIVGHSLGGWNGAHLSQILVEKGYNVDLLITLDPVGIGTTVISDIYFQTPTPKTNYWINITTLPEAKDYEGDDAIADFGIQWVPSNGVNLNDNCKYHHREAGKMFTKSLKNKDISASDMLLHFIKEYIKK